VTLYLPGGGQRTFTGFETNTQAFAYQQYDQTLLKRTGPNSYELLYGDGSKLIFSQSDGSVGSTRNVFMTEMEDPQGNAVTLVFDSNLRIVAVTDAIGQVTIVSYGPPSTSTRVSRVTDPFGRFATFTYDDQERLVGITDSIGLTSQIDYDDIIVDVPNAGLVTNYSSFIRTLTTPYGNTRFFSADGDNARRLEIAYPDGSHEIVQYDQTNNAVVLSDPPATVPTGMLTYNDFLRYRDTFYWDRIAFPSFPDHSKARVYHWLHSEDGASTSGALESTKQPLENRVWYDYAGQSLRPTFSSVYITSNTLPAHVGRVLDDGSTQLYTYAHDPFGHITNSIDPVGRTLSYLYDTNDIDLLEVRQTRGTNNELLVKATYNSQHRPLTVTDAAGQTTTMTYNARGQVLTATNPKNETATFTYDANGYLLAIDGALPGTNDLVTASYDTVGRVRTITTVSGYTLTFDYDNLDRVTRTTYPDGTFKQYTYDRLDLAAFQDRAGRQTLLDHDSMRRLIKKTDPLGRATRFEWCRCGALKSLTDPLGRTTSWLTDVQDRKIAKQYSDGSQVRYFYENSTSRLRQVVDEKQQSTFYAYNADDTLRAIVYANAAMPTPSVSFTYDPNYRRLSAISDGAGTTTYGYFPVSTPPALGAGHLASVDGPLPNATMGYAYDELGRAVQLSINGVASTLTLDPAGRIIGETNALGVSAYSYDRASGRVVSETFPNGQTGAMTYGGATQDFALQQLAFAMGSTSISLFGYGHNTPQGRITTWSQQAGSQPASLFTFGYDAADQLLSATVTNLGVQVDSFAYSYDPAGNRLTEHGGANSYAASYNTLNQITTTSASGSSRTNEWDAAHRLTAVNIGNERTEFTYDGSSRLVAIRKLVNGSEVSRRRFVWCGGTLCEERDATGTNVSKRFYPQGVKVETGPHAGAYYYTRDHLGSIRELTDSDGAVRARYTYDPFGQATKTTGDVDADFGFAGMFWSPEASLALTHFRAYDPGLGRWLSRDPLNDAERLQGPNLYAYVINNPVNLTDPSGKAPPPWLGGSLENSGIGTGTDTAGKLVSEGGQVSEEVVETTIEEEVESESVQALRAHAQQLLSQLGEGPSCALFEEVGAAGAGTTAAAVAFAALVGVGIGLALDHYFNVDGMAAKDGLGVENATGSRFLGGVVTLESATNPGFWIGHAIFGD
jgi:RHS repeat-associated protein